MNGPDVRREVVISEKEAADMVEDGMTISLGSNYPLAVTRQIIRKGLKNLTVIANAGGWDVDLMIGAGCVKKVVGYYFGAGLEVIGPFFRAAAENGDIEVWEFDEGMYLAGLMAAAQMLPFMPWRGGVGTCYPEINPDIKVFKDPLNGETLLAIPPIKPEIAFLRASFADPYGNAQFVDAGFSDTAHYRAADKTIVQVEKIVPNEEIRKNPANTSIMEAEAVVMAPFGSHPFKSAGYYIEDVAHLTEYRQVARECVKNGNRKLFEDYLKKYVYEPETHLDYLDRIGAKQLFSLFR
ncbi:MAG: CoA transferase subunit A [Deltaproteobacteria bacterium]|nr:CoA transferase subunit A [Deltaproteobacteria bacterium]